MLKIDFNPPKAQLCQFATIGLAGFTLIGAMATLHFGAPPVVGDIALALAAVLGLLGAMEITAPIKPLYVGMMILAWPIGMAVSLVLLALIYYGMFTPVAAFFRLTGRDPLNRKLDPNAKSYWWVREKPRTPASYLRLY